jgi:hypothetical protein
MRIDLITLCEAAVETAGKLHIIGTIDYFWAAQVPYVHPKCSIVMRIRFEPFENGQHDLRIALIDADGKPLAQASNMEFEVSTPDHDIPIIRHFILDIHSIRFDQYGQYALHVLLDGTEHLMLPFALVAARQMPRKPSVSS